MRAPHAREIKERSPALGWLEVHSENYFAGAGPHVELLRALRARYPVAAHGVGLSLGSSPRPDVRHLARLAALIAWLEPVAVSEHLAWSAIDGIHSNDLLPLPYTEASLRQVVAAVGEVQDTLQRQILIENVSSYVQYAESHIPEPEFLVELARRSGCGLLLDVNNVEVSALNHGFDPLLYLDAIPPALIHELHVAGHSMQIFGDESLFVDTHDRRVAPTTWMLLLHVLRRTGPRPVLVEWDVDLPPLAVLETEAAIADACLESLHARAA